MLRQTTDQAWPRFRRLDDHRDGLPPAKVISAGSHTEELELLAAGVASMPTAAAAARYHAVSVHGTVDTASSGAVAVRVGSVQRRARVRARSLSRPGAAP